MSMFDITQYTKVFSDINQLSQFVDVIYKYSQNPLILPVKTKLIELLFTGLQKVINGKNFKKRLEKDMKFQSMFTGYMMEVDSNPDETTRLEKLRKLINSYIKDEEKINIETYEIFQIARKLKSFEFIVLSATYKIFREGRPDHLQNRDADVWRKTVSERINDSGSTRALIFAAESTLVNHQLILPIREGYNEYRPQETFRLAELGVRMNELLEN